MKFLVPILAALLPLTASALDFRPKAQAPVVKVEQAKPADGLVLSKNNVIILRGEIDDDVITKALLELQTSKAEKPILYIISPGGSVMSGMKMIQYLLDTNRPIQCVADVAASMAFAIFQACPVRHVSPVSMLMQHQAAFGLDGQTENNKAYMSFILRMLDQMGDAQAERIGMSRAEFDKRILSDWWVLGEDAVKLGVADKVTKLTCDEEAALSTYGLTIMTWFGPIELTLSRCPLARAPLTIENLFSFPQEKRREVWKAVNMDQDSLSKFARQIFRP